MRVAVLGGGGFIGSNLARLLKQNGHWVRLVDKAFFGYRQPLYSFADEIMELDLQDLPNTLRAVRGVDWVVQLAADMGGVGFFSSNDYYPYMTNATINFNVLRACKATDIQRLFFAASACVYPTHLGTTADSPWLREDMIYPANCDMSYGWEKLMMLRLCERAPFDARVGIFDTIYGPYQEKEGDRMKFPTAIATKVLKGNPIEVWGDGSQQRVFLYIDDAVTKIYQILTEDYHGPVNVCSTEIVTVKQIADLCCEIVGIVPDYQFKLDAPVGVSSRKSSDEKWMKHYKTSPTVDSREGFKQLIQWLQDLK